MYKQTKKLKENRGKAVANSITQKKSNEKQGFGFKDNRLKNNVVAQLRQGVNRGSNISQLSKNNTIIQLAGTTDKLKRVGGANAAIGTTGAVTALMAGAGLAGMTVAAAAALVGWYGGSAVMYLYHKYNLKEGETPIKASAFAADTIYGRTTHLPWVSAWGYKEATGAYINPGSYIYVVSVDRKLYYAPDTGRSEGELNYMRHSQLSGGAAVLTAGYLNAGHGKRKKQLITVDNNSGHYMPTENSVKVAVDILKGYGKNAVKKQRQERD